MNCGERHDCAHSVRVLRPDVPFPPRKAAILSSEMDLENLIGERNEERLCMQIVEERIRPGGFIPLGYLLGYVNEECSMPR